MARKFAFVGSVVHAGVGMVSTLLVVFFLDLAISTLHKLDI